MGLNPTLKYLITIIHLPKWPQVHMNLKNISFDIKKSYSTYEQKMKKTFNQKKEKRNFLNIDQSSDNI